MNAFTRTLGGAVLGLLLAAGLAAPALAQKIDGKNTPTTAMSGDIDFGDDTSEWANDGECDDPRFEGAGTAAELVDADIMKDASDCRAAYEAGTVTLVGGGATPDVVAMANDIDFGDDSSEWANDGECDDPRFAGEGTAAELVDEDILKDATDCRAAYEAGTVTLAGDSGPDVAVNTEIDFGDDSSEWANDGECDDPRFTGEGTAAELVDADIMKDATDCRAAYEAGTVTLAGDSGPDVAVNTAIAFGDDSSEWANDGECDDPRFAGEGTAAELVDADIMKDATDCRTAYEAGTVTYVGDGADMAAIDYGDDTSEWANDGECDDPRFSGTGVAETTLDEDIGHDATDCREAVEAGTATFNGGSATPVAAFDYGSDWSKWANDGECDDLRFVGEGTDKKLLIEDEFGDATDCRTLEAEGKVTIRKVYTPEYAAGAPYDSSHVDFGDNTSSYADDDQCDDPRFQGPGTASTLLDSDELHDAADCKAAYEAGTIILNTES